MYTVDEHTCLYSNTTKKTDNARFKTIDYLEYNLAESMPAMARHGVSWKCREID
jgi:hypothetical protein